MTELNQTFWLAFDSSNGTYISDTSNNRVVLIHVLFPSPTENNSSHQVYLDSSNVFDTYPSFDPNFLWGEPAFGDSSLYPPSASTFCCQGAISVAPDGTFFVVSTGENRVLVFPPRAHANYSIAIGVIGQPNFASEANNSATADLVGMTTPYDVKYDSTTNSLWVADSFNNRILYYANILLLPIDMPASQVSFFGYSPNILLSAKGI